MRDKYEGGLEWGFLYQSSRKHCSLPVSSLLGHNVAYCDTHRQCPMLDTTDAIVIVLCNVNAAAAADSDTQFRSC
jgi:hypothetical protein